MVRNVAVILESRKHGDRSRGACNARLVFEHPQLGAARLPTIIEVTSEAAILCVNAAREPSIQDGPQCMLEFCNEMIADSRNGGPLLFRKVYWHVRFQLLTSRSFPWGILDSSETRKQLPRI